MDICRAARQGNRRCVQLQELEARRASTSEEFTLDLTVSNGTP
jgi:hypothetical protein